MKTEKLNKSEEVILKIIRKQIGEGITKRYRKTKDGDFVFYRLTRYDNAIASLKKKGIVFIDKGNILRETKRA